LKHNSKEDFMTESKRWPIMSLLAALSLTMTATTFAQDQEGGQSREVDGQPEEGTAAASGSQVAPNLTLARTTIRTETQGVTLSSNLFTAFAPTTVVCPSTHAAGCTIKVEASATIWMVTAGTVAQAVVNITGPGAAVDPNSLVNIDSTNTGPLATAHTFQWMKRGIRAGSTQTVNIFFKVGLKGDSAMTGFRTATIQLYLN
jgi:hypothetical protein